VSDVTRLTRLLPLACLAAAICLFASELMTTFEFTPPGGEPLDSQGGADRHGNALAVIAVFAIGALALAVLTASKPAATAVAIAGVIALLIFLLVDLPDANAVGTLDDPRQSFFDAEAVPQGGFWLEMVGALALAVTGIALATLTPEQLAALRPGKRERRTEPRAKEGQTRPASGVEPASSAEPASSTEPASSAEPASGAAAHKPAKPEGALRRLTRRPRARQRG
jgi:hypothetical protein